MALSQNNTGGPTYYGLSTDAKPLQSVPDGAIFIETDSNLRYVWIGGDSGNDTDWVELGSPVYLQAGLPSAINGSSATNARLRVLQACTATRLDIDQTETRVTDSPCYLVGAFGNDGNTGYSDFINASAVSSGNTPVFRVNLGDGANDKDFKGTLFSLGLCVDGESVGHDITVLWIPA